MRARCAPRPGRSPSTASTRTGRARSPRRRPMMPAEVEASAAADREAAEAEALCRAVEERVLGGGPEATKTEIGHLGLARFAKLRAEAANRRAERAREAERQRQLAELREEVDAYASDSGAGLAGLLEEVERAAAAFVQAVADRDAKLAGWQGRMRALGVPEHSAPISPPDAHGQLGYDGTIRVIAGMRRLRDLDTPSPEPSPQHFYRGPGGAVITRDVPYPPEEVARLELVPVSRMEAWGA